jgi:hypothetical protein
MLNRLKTFFHKHYHTRYHGVYQHAKQLFVFDLFLLVLAIGMLITSVVLFIWKPGLQDQINLTISLGNARIKSGEQVDVTITFENHSKYALEDAVLGVRFPPGFVLDRAADKNSGLTAQNTFDIKKLPPGGNGNIVLHGQLWTTPGHDERFIASLVYTPENSKNREQKFGASIIALPESVLVGELKIATSTFAGTPLAYSYSLTNSSDQTITNVFVRKNWREATDESESAIPLEPHSSKTISGFLPSRAQANVYTYAATPEVLVNGTYIAQQKSVQQVEVVLPTITSRAKIIDPAAYVDGGQTLPVEVEWQNTSKYTLDNLKLELRFTPGVVDLVATARENNFKLQNGLLIIDSSSRTALANGKPGSSDRFSIIVHLLPLFNTHVENANLEVTPVITGGLSNVPGQTFSQNGEVVKIPLATQLKLTVEPRYYTDDGDQLGRGPLPPQVGQTTKYWVLARASNTTNAVRDVRFNAILPSGVSFTGKQSVTIGQPITYSDADHSLRWAYNELPANSQTGLYFEVAVTPVGGQVGSPLQLVRSIKFTATDERVNKTINLTAPDVTNVLPKADRGSTSGAAVK